MVKLPKWKELKESAKVDPAKAEELRRGLETGFEKGRKGLASRLAGPAAHLKNVGSEFKSGLTQSEVPASPAPPAAPGDTTATEPSSTDKTP